MHNATAQAYGPRVANVPELLKTFDLAHKRGRCVCAEETRKDEISLHTGGVRNQGTIFSRKVAGEGGWIPEAYLC